jgi:hypothetical protein
LTKAAASSSDVPPISPIIRHGLGPRIALEQRQHVDEVECP